MAIVVKNTNSLKVYKVKLLVVSQFQGITVAIPVKKKT